MSTVHIIDHPLITHKLSIMRNKKTGSKDFRELLGEIAMLMGYELTRDLPLEDVTIETPITKMKAKMISGKKLAIVPILRAGLGMVDGLLELVPVAKVGHIGLYRDPETHNPVEYYCKLPNDIEDRIVILVDPMLATGGSACDALAMLKKHATSALWRSSVRPRALRECRRSIPMLTSSLPLLTNTSTIMRTLFPVSAMPATVYSAQNKK